MTPRSGQPPSTSGCPKLLHHTRTCMPVMSKAYEISYVSDIRPVQTTTLDTSVLSACCGSNSASKKGHMQSINHLIAAIVIAGVIGFIGWQYVQTQQFIARNNAVNDCMEIARYTFENTSGVTSLEIVDNYYNKCMEAKKIQ